MILSRAFSFFVLSFLIFSTSLGEFKVPRLTAPVVDQAQLLPSSHKAKLNSVLSQLKQNGGSQVQVLTLENLGGLEIEQASIQVVDKWKLGDAQTDKGVLLLIAQQEKRIRIEVGQGLEGDLTDAHSKRIIDEVIVPLFRAGQPESGILLGVMNIVEKTDPSFPIKEAFSGQGFRSRARVKKKQSLLSRIFQGFLLLFMLIMFIRNPMLFLLLLSGSGRGGGMGRGGGLGGGGGWSGGGGGFSGGGASGGW